MGKVITFKNNDNIYTNGNNKIIIKQPYDAYKQHKQDVIDATCPMCNEISLASYESKVRVGLFKKIKEVYYLCPFCGTEWLVRHDK